MVNSPCTPFYMSPSFFKTFVSVFLTSTNDTVHQSVLLSADNVPSYIIRLIVTL